MQEESTLAWLEQYMVAQKKIIPEDTNPFYIVTPPYTRLSAGIKVLHSLCHYLNQLGEDAYIIPYPIELQSDPRWPYFCSFPKSDWYNFRLNVKILTQEILDSHYEKGLTPICIVPEVYDNPFNAPFVVRYILNYPGLIAPKYRTPQQFTVSYSKRIAEYVGSPHVLHIPTVDMNFFHDDKSKKHSGTCFYAAKYQSVLGGKPDNLPAGCVEILRSEFMSTEDVRRIFWESKYFYCFEDTALAIEAVLCGCSVIFVPNEHLKDGTISSFELENSGFAWGTNPDEIATAESTKGRMEEIMKDLYKKVPGSIHDLSVILKKEISKVQYKNKIVLPYVCKTVFLSPDEMIENGTHEDVYVPEEQPENMNDIIGSGSHNHEKPVQTTHSAESDGSQSIKKLKLLIKHILGDWLLSPVFKQFVKRIWLFIRKKVD